jgi:hypothetical protein
MAQQVGSQRSACHKFSRQQELHLVHTQQPRHAELAEPEAEQAVVRSAQQGA